ncbi:hypothetical protein VFPPC_17668 [Pochonia chlamydosporia 170]|uniref:Uncharacterized protein n=1 Tax=Pochonia chlamydosporia 170 TaxID=1380566 RepID=A0A219AQW5_METCM|nr:hypothetical protein VFPPC_17668 [Pochonia chlamydosporia 170]OWT43156.1 hypothetical protein VFPPC_17668 [Pochonia chlamydosporia 170]
MRNEEQAVAGKKTEAPTDATESTAAPTEILNPSKTPINSDACRKSRRVWSGVLRIPLYPWLWLWLDQPESVKARMLGAAVRVGRFGRSFVWKSRSARLFFGGARVAWPHVDGKVSCI